MNLHAALQATAALFQAANETLMQGVDVDVRRAGFVTIRACANCGSSTGTRRPHPRCVEQLQLRRVCAHGLEVALDLRRLFPRANHERAARREQRVLDEATRRPLEKWTARARQRAYLR